MIFADIKNPKLRKKFVSFWKELDKDLPGCPEKTLAWRAMQQAYWYACQTSVTTRESNKAKEPNVGVFVNDANFEDRFNR